MFVRTVTSRLKYWYYTYVLIVHSEEPSEQFNIYKYLSIFTQMYVYLFERVGLLYANDFFIKKLTV